MTEITDEEHQRICEYLSQLKEHQAKTADLDLSTVDSIKDWENRARDMLDWLGIATRAEYEIVERYRNPVKEAPAEVMDAFFELQSATMKLARNVGIAADTLYKMTGVPREEQEDLKERRKNERPVVSVGSKKASKILIPVDKVTRTMFNLGPIEGKEDFPIKVEKEGSKEKIDIPLSIDFTEIQRIAPQINELTQYDKRVLIIADGLFRAGNQIVSFDQIYRYTGHKGFLKGLPDEGKAEKDRIDKSFSALNAEIIMDNQAEVDAGYRYPHAKLKGPILPNERILLDDEIVMINGKKTDSAIRIFNKARIIDFAVDRGQVAEIPIEVYQTPFQKTDDQIALEDYFLTWLIRALDSKRASDRTKKMSTIYRAFHMTGTTATDRQRRARLREKIIALFDYYRKLELTVNGKQLDRVTMDDNLKLTLKKVE